MSTVTDQEREAVRQELRDFMHSRPDLQYTDLTPFTTLSDSAIRTFAAANIAGGAEVIRQVRDVIRKARAGDILAPGGGNALVLAEDHEARPRRLRKVKNFYQTQTVRRIAEVLDYCSENAAIGVVTADFGVGKTEAVKAWQRGAGRRVQAIVIEFDEFLKSNKVDFVRQLAELLGISAGRGSWQGAEVFRQVCAALRERPCLLIFDQCELAQTRIFQIIRQIWDRTNDAGVGVVLLAAPILATRMLGSRMADLGALTSRVGIWAMLGGVTRNEFAAILKQEGTADIDDTAADLWWRATGGSMRRLMRALDLLQAKHAGRRITERTIQGVAGSLWGMNLPVQHEPKMPDAAQAEVTAA